MVINQRWLVFVASSLCCVYTFVGETPSWADVVPDKTGIGTKVDKKPKSYEITGGRKIGRNLLHSFFEFSFSKGWTAEFLSLPKGVRNIISRVTGPGASNIDGTLKVGGTDVNLFLLNPNGIMFGPNAKLDLSGSFLATTAESIKFSDNSIFSANPVQDPLLTLGVPTGLQFGANPGQIDVNLSEGTNRSFKVKPGQTLALVGGEVELHGNNKVDDNPNKPGANLNRSNNLQAENGRIEIGSVSAGETVEILQPTDDLGLALDYTNTKEFKDIRIDNALFVGDGFSDVFIYGRNINIEDKARVGGFNASTTSPQKKFGSIFIDASTGSITLKNRGTIRTASSDPDDPLKIDIKAQNLNLINESRINSGALRNNKNTQKSGDITIDLTRNLNLEKNSIITSSIGANGDPVSVANATAGDIDIKAKSIRLDGGSDILAEAKNKISEAKKSEGGNITLNVEDSLILTNGIESDGNRTEISAFGQTQAGVVDIDSRSIFQDNYTQIGAKSIDGNGGSIILNVKDSIILRHNSKIATSSKNGGDGGYIEINAGAIAAVPGEKSSIKATTGQGVEDKVGTIKINTQGLFGLSRVDDPSGDKEEGISAFSYSNPDPDQQGSISINRLATNAIFNFTEPPPQLQTQPLEAICFDNQRSDRDSFVNAGRGGLPSNPSEPTVSSALWQDLRSPSLTSTPQPPSPLKPAPEPIQTQKSPTAPVVEAQGWIFKPDGTVNLVASAATTNASESSGKPCIVPEQTAAQESIKTDEVRQ